jgi:divalent metal cation (Fe/Co/Zn/Cd) transporter
VCSSDLVFGEDIAALLGLLFALLAILTTFITGNPLWDALGTISIGVLLIVIAVFIAIEVKDLLIGQSVDPKILAEMRQFLETRPEIQEMFNLLTMQFGPDAMVAVKARMVPTGSELDLIAAINRVERDFRSRFEMTSWLFFEPDVED